KLFAAYSAKPDGFLTIFSEGVSESSSPNEGSGEGAAFQALCKSCPAFAVEAAAVGLRTIRQHWGPINRHEAEVRPEADQLLQQVLGVIDSAIVVAGPMRPGPSDLFAEILKRLKRLENFMTGTAVATPPPTATNTTLPQIDVARIEQDIARLGQIAATFSQFANTLGQLPTTGLPPQIAQLEQSIARLGQIAGTFSQFATGLSGQAATTAPSRSGTVTTPQLSPIDKVLGGEALVGLKTPLAIAAYAIMWILQAAGVVGTATGAGATTTGSVLTALISALGAMGVTAKFDRAFQAISAISALLQKLPTLPPPPPAPKTGGP